MKTPARSIVQRTLLWLPPILYAVLIFHLSADSNPLPALTSLVWDKALHAIEYAGLGLLLCRAFRGERVGWWLSVALALVVASAYAGSDEWHQSFVAGRDSDIVDWVADTIGAVLGSVGYGSIAVLIWFQRDDSVSRIQQ
jgi:VanZ family protein